MAGAMGSGRCLGAAASGTGSSLISTGPPSLLAFTVAFTDVGGGAGPLLGFSAACACKCISIQSLPQPKTQRTCITVELLQCM